MAAPEQHHSPSVVECDGGKTGVPFTLKQQQQHHVPSAVEYNGGKTEVLESSTYLNLCGQQLVDAGEKRGIYPQPSVPYLRGLLTAYFIPVRGVRGVRVEGLATCCGQSVTSCLTSNHPKVYADEMGRGPAH